MLDFWMGLGIDGMRLDAVPYLFAREGTDCENLPETHGFLKKLREHVDENFPTACCWPKPINGRKDAVTYFGEEMNAIWLFIFL